MRKARWPSSIRRFWWTVLFLTASALALAGCGGQQTAGADDAGEARLRVTATIGMIGDVAQQIGGDRVAVTTLMGPGIDPHLYKASQGDVKRLDEADMIFYNGLHLEGKMTDILETLGKRKTVVAVTRDIPEDRLMEAGGAYDPHVWFDVGLWTEAAKTIRDALAAEDPAHAAEYETRAADYLAKLADLDAYARDQLATVPEEGRVLVTAHDAFGYFGRAYGIEVVGLQGISTASEYGSNDIIRLRDLLVQRKIKAVFVESSIPKDSIQAVIEGAREKGHDVVIGGELFSDAMGPAGTEEGTYLGMVRHNVDTIVSALK